MLKAVTYLTVFVPIAVFQQIDLRYPNVISAIKGELVVY